MRVLHIVTHLGGGVGKAVSGLILGCNDVNIEHEVIMLEIPQNVIYVNELKKNGIKVNICNKVRKIIDIIEKSDVVVISWWNHPAMLKMFLDMSFIKARMILWCHVNGCVYPFLNYKFTTLFDKVFFTSEYSYENSLWTNNQRKEIIEKSEVILGMGDFKPELIKPKESYVCNEIFTIGYIGTVNFSKMNKHFFEFCREVILQYKNIKILIVGNYDKECIHAAKEMGIYEYCEFIGQVNNVYEYMSKMDVVAYLLSENNYATTENVLIECMAYGMPIIIMNNKPEGYIIRNKKTGFVVNNKEEFTTIISYLYNSEINREKIGQEARKDAIERYNSEKNIMTYITEINEIMNQKKKIHKFKDVFKEDVFENFLIYTGQDGEYIRNSVYDKDRFGEFYQKGNSIYFNEKKGSIKHFYEYFNESKELESLCKNITEYEKIRNEIL